MESSSDSDLYDDSSSTSSCSSRDDDNRGQDRWTNYADRTLNLDGDNEESVWMFSPRSLRCQSAVQLIVHAMPGSLNASILPSSIYPLLLFEAFRLKCGSWVSHLVSTWPLPNLDLQNVDFLLGGHRCHFTRPTRDRLSLADMVIEGLLNLKPESKLTRVLLPHNEFESAATVRRFAQMPLFCLRDHPCHALKKWVQSQIRCPIDVKGYIENVVFPKCPVTYPEAGKVTLHLPGSIQWLGRYSNVKDLVIGLALQDQSPFRLHLDKLVLKNSINLKLIGDLLNLISSKEHVKKIVFTNRRQAEPLHIFIKFAALCSTLKEFYNLESLISEFDGLHVYRLNHPVEVGQVIKQSAVLFSHWKALRELDLSSNLLIGRLSDLLSALPNPLSILNLAATEINNQDLNYLACSHHASNLVVLKLMNNDLHSYINALITLLQNLKKIEILNTAGCQLTCDDGILMARALQMSETLNAWNMKQNLISTSQEINSFLVQCRGIPSLKMVGCKPFDLHIVFAGLYVHSNAPQALTDKELAELGELADQLNLSVY